MRFHVRAHVSGFWESLTTLVTLVWLLSSVPTDVYLESAWPHKLCVTFIALIRTLVLMPSWMIGKMPLSRESFPAALNLTHEGLLPCVDPLMSFEIPPLCESFPAPRKLADKGLIAGLRRAIIGQRILHESFDGCLVCFFASTIYGRSHKCRAWPLNESTHESSDDPSWWIIFHSSDDYTKMGDLQSVWFKCKIYSSYMRPQMSLKVASLRELF